MLMRISHIPTTKTNVSTFTKLHNICDNVLVWFSKIASQTDSQKMKKYMLMLNNFDNQLCVKSLTVIGQTLLSQPNSNPT